MSRPGGRFAGGVELAVCANVIRLIVREIDPNTFIWLADVRIRTPFVSLTDALGESITDCIAHFVHGSVLVCSQSPPLRRWRGGECGQHEISKY